MEPAAVSRALPQAAQTAPGFASDDTNTTIVVVAPAAWAIVAFDRRNATTLVTRTAPPLAASALRAGMGSGQSIQRCGQATLTIGVRGRRDFGAELADFLDLQHSLLSNVCRARADLLQPALLANSFV